MTLHSSDVQTLVRTAKTPILCKAEAALEAKSIFCHITRPRRNVGVEIAAGQAEKAEG